MKEDYTEVFYYCQPDKATTCEKRNCYLNGGNCALTTNPMWGKKKVTVDKVHVKPRK
jgi:hypothetical protein